MRRNWYQPQKNQNGLTREYYEEFCDSVLDNLDEMAKFLGMHKLQKVKQEKQKICIYLLQVNIINT